MTSLAPGYFEDRTREDTESLVRSLRTAAGSVAQAIREKPSNLVGVPPGPYLEREHRDRAKELMQSLRALANEIEAHLD